jgi:SAM-dependent methyltransferase
MAAWSDGYFTGVQYIRQYHAHMAPGSMAFACLRQGIRPPELGAESTYLELGCGQGYGLNLIAAANPAMRFFGIDFNPGQIANAQRLARAARLDNVQFQDLSFEQLLSLPEGRIPPCDIIALHGVLSWVSPENRALIVRILDRHLKPGGMVAVSYNALPGWAPFMPLRGFVKAYFDRASGPPTTRALDAFRAANELVAQGALGLGAAEQVKPAIERALKSDPAYLIHEYLNDHFHPLLHAEVARELDGARLTFAASARLAEDMVSLSAPQAMQGRIEAEPDPMWRETLLDYATGRRFRRDIFVRGPNALGALERDSLLRKVRFALIKPRERVTLDFDIPLGSLKGDPAIYGAVADALAGGPRSLDELSQLSPFAAAVDGPLLKAVGLLVSAGAAHPMFEEASQPHTAVAFNKAILDRLAYDSAGAHLAAGAIGGGVQAGFADLLALSVADDKKPDLKATAQRGWEILARNGAQLTKDGKALSGQAATEAELVELLTNFQANCLPLYRDLGVV